MAKALYGSKKRYHYLYKTLNIINGKYYYGMHSTNTLEDGYLGSGTYLKRSLNKHGKENHEIEILEFFDSREALVEGEKKLITEEDVLSKECMNLRPGGKGGLTGEEHKRRWGVSGSNAIKELWKSSPEYRVRMSEIYRKSTLQRAKKEGEGFPFRKYVRENGGAFLGRKHTEETREQMSLVAKKRLEDPTKNTQYGTCWITDGKSSKKMKKVEKLPRGWKLGRVLRTLTKV